MIAQRPLARRIAVGLVLASALVTSACAAGQVAETAQEKATLDGTNVNIGDIALRALSVQTPDAPNYPIGSNPLVQVVIVNNGQSTDKLVSISSSVSTGWGSYTDQSEVPQAGSAGAAASSGAGSAAASSGSSSAAASSGAGSAAASSGSSSAASAGATPGTDSTAAVSIPAGGRTAFGVPSANGRVLALLGTKKVLYPGNEISITFDFAEAGSKTFVVPIQISDNNTGSYHPTPQYLPTAGATPAAG